MSKKGERKHRNNLSAQLIQISPIVSTTHAAMPFDFVLCASLILDIEIFLNNNVDDSESLRMTSCHIYEQKNNKPTSTN